MKNIKTEPTKTVLTISVGFMVVFLATELKWSLYVALVVGLIGIFSTFLSGKIDYLWMKLAWILSLIVPNILLSLVFYVVLFPFALLSRISGKDGLMLKKQSKSVFRDREKSFDKASFEKPW